MEQPRPPTVFLMVNHNVPGEAMHTLYNFQLPLNLLDYEGMIDSDGYMTDSKNISPILTFKDPNFMPLCASVTLGSKIYFFGGIHDHVKDKSLHCKVQFFDTEHPERGMQTVSPLTCPKLNPCTFVADGMIYALGAYLGSIMYERKPLPGCKDTGFFERYDPSLDQWQVLPDPPLSNTEWANAQFTDHATVVGRRVFIGSLSLHAVFNLDLQGWEQLPPIKHNANCFASFFVQEQDTASFYRLQDPLYFRGPAQIIKKGPLALTTTGTTTEDEQTGYLRNLMHSFCLDSGKGQVVAKGTDLEDMFFAHSNFNTHRNLLHLGDRLFCYVATSQLADFFHRTHYEPKSRGVWIKIFQDVSADTQGGNSKAKFRTLATFCYKLNTNFSNRASYIRCHVVGTVPDSWIKAPLVKRLAIKPKPKKTPAVQRHHEAENAENGEAKYKKLEEQNRRLIAELAVAKELVNTLKKYYPSNTKCEKA